MGVACSYVYRILRMPTRIHCITYAVATHTYVTSYVPPRVREELSVNVTRNKTNTPKKILVYYTPRVVHLPVGTSHVLTLITVMLSRQPQQVANTPWDLDEKRPDIQTDLPKELDTVNQINNGNTRPIHPWLKHSSN